MLKYKKKPTPKKFEQDVAKFMRSRGHTVIRADAGNYLPDYLSFSKQTVSFIEVKRYCSCTSLKQVFDKIRRHQAQQTETIRALSFVIPVHYVIMLKDLGVTYVTVDGGRIVGTSGAHSFPSSEKVSLSKVRKSPRKPVRPPHGRRVRPSVR